MAIDLQLPDINEIVKRRFNIPKNISDEFDLYVAAAREQQPSVDESLVIQVILDKHLKKDRSFRSWLKARKASGGNGGSPSKSVSGVQDQ
jgi:hypothetical protein